MRGHPVRNGGILAFLGFLALVLTVTLSTPGVTRSPFGGYYVTVQVGDPPRGLTFYDCAAKALPGEDPRCPEARRAYRNWVWRTVVMLVGGALVFLIGLVWFVRGVRAAGHARRAAARAGLPKDHGTWQPDPDAWDAFTDPPRPR